MICDKCKYYEHVEHNVYYCHSIGTFLEIDETTKIKCKDFKPNKNFVLDIERCQNEMRILSKLQIER